jgi:apolipoprotein N-acyltransferase
MAESLQQSRHMTKLISSHNWPISVSTAMASALLYSVAFVPYNLWYLSWIAFVPVLYTILKSSKDQAFVCGATFFITVITMRLNWLILTGEFFSQLFILFIASFAIIGGLAAIFINFLKERTNPTLVSILIPAFWIVAEGGIKLIGEPYLSIAMTQRNVPFLLQISKVLGDSSLVFLIIFVNTLVTLVLLHLKELNKLKKVFYIAIGVVVLEIGINLTMFLPVKESKTVTVVAIQTDNLIAAPALQLEPIFEAPYDDLTLRVEEVKQLLHEAVKKQPQFVVLPQSVLNPVDLVNDLEWRKKVGDWARDGNLYLVVGFLEKAKEGSYNAAAIFSPNGDLIGVTRKTNVIAEELKRGILPNDEEPKVFDTQYGKVGMAIGYDDRNDKIFSALRRNGAQLIFYLANDSYLPISHRSLHVAASVLHAAKNQIPVIKSAIRGVAVITDHFGTIKKEANTLIREILVDDVALTQQPPPLFSYTGEWLRVVSLLFLLITFTYVIFAKPHAKQ